MKFRMEAGTQLLGARAETSPEKEKMMDCEKHLWDYEKHEPIELWDLGFRGCPLCILWDTVDSAFRAEDWERGERLNAQYVASLERHRAKLTPHEQKEFDRRAAATWLAHLRTQR